MKPFLKNALFTIIGSILGGIGGYAYYHYYGCENGCAITSKPLNSILYGMVTGGLLFSSIKIKSKRNQP